MKWAVTYLVRRTGAIGDFWHKTVEVEADNAESATDKAFDVLHEKGKYETNSCARVVEVTP